MYIYIYIYTHMNRRSGAGARRGPVLPGMLKADPQAQLGEAKWGRYKRGWSVFVFLDVMASFMNQHFLFKTKKTDQPLLHRPHLASPDPGCGPAAGARLAARARGHLELDQDSLMYIRLVV